MNKVKVFNIYMISPDNDVINFEIGDEPFSTFDSLNNEIFITLL